MASHEQKDNHSESKVSSVKPALRPKPKLKKLESGELIQSGDKAVVTEARPPTPPLLNNKSHTPTIDSTEGVLLDDKPEPDGEEEKRSSLPAKGTLSRLIGQLELEKEADKQPPPATKPKPLKPKPYIHNTSNSPPTVSSNLSTSPNSRNWKTPSTSPNLSGDKPPTSPKPKRFAPSAFQPINFRPSSSSTTYSSSTNSTASSVLWENHGITENQDTFEPAEKLRDTLPQNQVDIEEIKQRGRVGSTPDISTTDSSLSKLTPITHSKSLNLQKGRSNSGSSAPQLSRRPNLPPPPPPPTADSHHFDKNISTLPPPPPCGGPAKQGKIEQSPVTKSPQTSKKKPSRLPPPKPQSPNKLANRPLPAKPQTELEPAPTSDAIYVEPEDLMEDEKQETTSKVKVTPASVDTCDYLSPNSLTQTISQSNDDSLPRGLAPEPPGFHNTDTLRSQASSNVYEDIMTDSEGENSFDSETGEEDPFSENLDATFDHEETGSVLSEREDKAESESTDSETESQLAETPEQIEDKKRAKIIKIVEELRDTEKSFVSSINLLNVDFRKHISDAAEDYGGHIIPPQSMNKILNNLPQLTLFNEGLLEDFTLRVENWSSNPMVADIFVQKGNFLMLYTSYIREYSEMTQELENSLKEFPDFKEKVEEFCKLKCNNLNIESYMLKPIQRIPRYALLLKEYRKYLPADSPDQQYIEEALKIVSKVADHANEARRDHEAQSSLVQLQASILGDFKVIEPGRTFIKQGDVHKQSRKEAQLRTFILFNDTLLITSPTTGALYYKIKYVLPITNMSVEKPQREDFQKQFRVITSKRSLTAICSSPKERDEWVDVLYKTIKERAEKISTFNPRRGGKDSKAMSHEFELGEQAPVWIPDHHVTMCAECCTEFTMFFRRHHCRACGHVVCSDCSSFEAPLKYKDYRAQRVCSTCYKKLLDASLYGSLMKSGFNAKTKSEGQLTQSDIVSRFTRKHDSISSSPKVKRQNKTGVLVEVQANELGEISGYLWVHVGPSSAKKRNWKKFWFVLKNKVLYKYNAPEDAAAIESKPLLGYTVKLEGQSPEGLNNILFTLSHPASNIIEPVLFKSESCTSADSWVAKMTESTEP